MRAPAGERHATAVNQACALARLLQAGAPSCAKAEVQRLIAGALVRAGKTAQEGHSIAAWALAHIAAPEAEAPQ
jgi:hypothetical protein